MAKFRKRVNTKGKRWKKGQSSSTNPSINKYRQAAQTGFFAPLQGESNLTKDAVEKHDIYNDDDDEDIQSLGGRTFKTFDTFASNWTCVTNQSFNGVLRRFRSDSEMHKNMLAVLAAVTEVIKENNGTESTTEYFAALMTSLNSAENDDNTVAAILNVLSICIKSTPKSVLQKKFSESSTILVGLLAKYSETEKAPILRAILGCLSILLRNQEAAIWNTPSTLRILDSLLAFVVHSKPKIRKAAQYSIIVIARSNYVTQTALSHIAKHCIRLVEGIVIGNVTTTLHTLTLLKEILHTFPKNELKECCESILKIMTMKNLLLNSCGMQALHGMFVNRPSVNCLPSKRNARLITALYQYQPPSDDVQPIQAWLVTLQEAYINLAQIDLHLCMANIVKLFQHLIELYYGQRADIMTAVTYTLQAIIADCLLKAATAQPKYNQQFLEILQIFEEFITHEIGTALPHILHLLSALFKECGKYCPKMFTSCLKSVAELRDMTDFAYKNELENAVGSAIRSMGPLIVIDTVPLKITAGSTDRQFKRSWLLPVLKDNIKESTLKCFMDRFLPIAVLCRNESDRLKQVNDQIGAISYDLLQSQIWSLLPSFSAQASDITQSFPSLAKTLGTILTSRKDLRLIILSSLRKLINYSVDNNREDDINTMAKYAKNYLPILFNIFTTKVTGSDEEGTRLAAFETIKVYLKIAEQELRNELFDKAFDKVQNKETNEFIKESVMDLLRALLPCQDINNIDKLYNELIIKISESENHKEQKKYYRLLEEIFISDSANCTQFLNENLEKINELILGSLSKTTAVSKGVRLKCILEVLKRTEYPTSMLETILPETVLCVKDINNKCRLTAFKILSHIAENLSASEYLPIILSGLAGNPTMASCSLLALAAIVFYLKDTLEPEVEEQLLYNVGLFAICNTREIVSAALSFIKVYLSAYPREKVSKYLPNLMKLLSNMNEDCKRHNRTKTRDILSRLVRWFGGEILLNLVPKKDETLKIRIRNLAKIHVRRQKRRDNERLSKATTEISTLTIGGNKQKSIEEILNESDSDLQDDDDDDEENERSNNKRKNKNKQKTWIAETADDIIDFTDIRSSNKITGTKPESSVQQINYKKTNKKVDFKTAPDGRLIITDQKMNYDEDVDDEDDDDTLKKRKKKKKPIIPGLEDSDDDYEPSDDDVLTRTTGMGLKRSLSTSTINTTSHVSKYKAGGSGIHRPIRDASTKKKNNKSKNKGDKVLTGAEYKAKKAKGDMKIKGKPDPYAYLPLKRNALNKRKRMKTMLEMKKILKAAKTGSKFNVNKNNRRKLIK